MRGPVGDHELVVEQEDSDSLSWLVCIAMNFDGIDAGEQGSILVDERALNYFFVSELRLARERVSLEIWVCYTYGRVFDGYVEIVAQCGYLCRIIVSHGCYFARFSARHGQLDKVTMVSRRKL